MIYRQLPCDAPGSISGHDNALRYQRVATATPKLQNVVERSCVQLHSCSGHAIVVADSGSENVNGTVDDVLDGEELTRVLAQVEVTFSNSMIEAFWRSLKHPWLYLHSLDSLAALRRLVEFYVDQHNVVMPHSAFQGQTPDEVFVGVGDEVARKLADAHKTARESRLNENRAAACRRMRLGDEIGGVATATAALQNVMRRSWVVSPRCSPS